MTTCKACSHPVLENFCSRCGQPIKLKRIDAHYIVHEIQHVLHFEKGIFYTIKELAIRPGKSVREFIAHNRSRLVKPIIFIIVSSLIYSIITHFFHLDDGYIQLKAVTSEDSAIVAIFKWVENHYGYSNIIMGVFIAAWAKLFFKKYDYNFFEIVILLCFVIGMGMLDFAIFAIIEGLAKVSLMEFSTGLFIVYATWAIAQFFDQKKVANYLKALGAYILGTISFALVAFLVGFAVDAIMKH